MLGGEYSRSIFKEGPVPMSNPIPFNSVYHFAREGPPFVNLLLKKGTPIIYVLKNTASFSTQFE